MGEIFLSFLTFLPLNSSSFLLTHQSSWLRYHLIFTSLWPSVSLSLYFSVLLMILPSFNCYLKGSTFPIQFYSFPYYFFIYFSLFHISKVKLTWYLFCITSLKLFLYCNKKLSLTGLCLQLIILTTDFSLQLLASLCRYLLQKAFFCLSESVTNKKKKIYIHILICVDLWGLLSLTDLLQNHNWGDTCRIMGLPIFLQWH